MSYKQLKKRTEGFTIIEVLIVLAIAGLIMLIVFLAVPALQRNQRNNARVSDVARIAASVTDCMANRNGVTGSCDTLAELNPGTLNQITALGSSSTSAATLTFNTVCNADNSASTATGATARQFTLVYQQEPSVTVCVAS
jgi:prepilin-type N-terminal cleavage/methylation domain-containing protein